MRTKRGFSPEVKGLAARAYNNFCWLCDRPGSEVHHRVPNTDLNEKLYPNFLQSIFNAAYLCRGCHDDRKAELDIKQGVAIAYEQYLKGWKIDVLAQKKEGSGNA